MRSAENWPNLTHQCRDALLAAVQSAGVDITGKWLSEAAVEAIQKLQQEIAELREEKWERDNL